MQPVSGNVFALALIVIQEHHEQPTSSPETAAPCAGGLGHLSLNDAQRCGLQHCVLAIQTPMVCKASHLKLFVVFKTTQLTSLVNSAVWISKTTTEGFWACVAPRYNP